jgi:hypothetical protein
LAKTKDFEVRLFHLISAHAKESLRWFNHNGASLGAIILLAGMCALLHFFAELKLEMSNRRFLLMDARAIREIKLIDFMDAHYWIAIAYFAACFGMLMWLKLRCVSWYYSRLAFAMLALPCVAYVWACMHIWGKFVAF